MAISGTNLILYYRGTGGTYVPFAASTNCSFDSQTEQIEVTSYNSDWFKEYKNDSMSWTVICDGLICGFDYKMMLDAQLNRTKISFKFTVGLTSPYTIYGRAYITSLNIGAPVEGVSTYSITLTGDGQWQYTDPTSCRKYLVSITSSVGGTVQWTECDTFNLKSISTSGPAQFYQCAVFSGGLAQIDIISGTGTISPSGYCGE